MRQKEMAAKSAMNYVKEGMVIGLGTGTTVFFFLEALGEAVKNGLKVLGVCSSEETYRIATQFGIPIRDINQVSSIDLVVDGVDEIDSNFIAIKGGGGALLREKILAKRGKYVIWILDENKVVKKLGEKFPLPIEVLPYGCKQLLEWMNKNYGVASIREMNGSYYVTDNGNYIIDVLLDDIKCDNHLEQELLLIPGIIEVGIFDRICDKIIIGKTDGCKIIEKQV